MTEHPPPPSGPHLSFVNDWLAASRRFSDRAAAGRTPFTPPPGTDRILTRFTGAAGVGGAIVHNADQLFTEGYCPTCRQPRGARSDLPLKIRFLDAYSWRYGGGLAQVRFGERISVTLLYFSERFLALLTPEERARFAWREVRNLGKGKYTMYELTGSTHHVRLARLRGGNPDREHCDACGWTQQPEYLVVGQLPAWLDPENDGKRRDQPDWYINVHEVPASEPACFTVGDWRESVSLAFTTERWTQIKKQKGSSGVQGLELGAVAPEVIES